MITHHRIKKILTVAAVSLCSFGFFTATAFAQVPGKVGTSDPKKTDSADVTAANAATNGNNFQIVSCAPTYDPTNPGTLKNDCNFDQLVTTVYRLIVYVMYIIIPIMGAMLIFVGFKYMTAGGDANLVGDAKRMLKPLLIGIFLIFAAWLIVHTILDKLLAANIGGISKTNIIGNP